MAESRLVQGLQRRLYPDAASRDPVIPFLEEVTRRVGPDDRVLDVGAGAGEENPHTLRGRCAEVVGVDVDPRVVDNPCLDRGVVADLGTLPFDEASFDLALSIYVVEHIEDPAAFVGELRRVLRPGGTVLALIPNRYHYAALAAQCTPDSFHRWFNDKRGRAHEDTFPTRYRLNSRRAIRRHFTDGGFTVESLRGVEVQPNYLTLFAPAFLAGALFERTVNRFDRLEALRVNYIGVFRRV